MSPFPHRKMPRFDGRLRAFTLLELLAAMGVMTILVVLIGQITTTTSKTISLSNQTLDAASQARLAFGRLAVDFAGLVKRSDTDFIAQNANTGSSNNLLVFLSSVTSGGVSSSNNRGLSMIAYRVAPHSDNNNLSCLQRGGKPIPWNDSGALQKSGFMGLQVNGLPIGLSDALFPSGLMPSNESEFDVLAPGVIRMVVGFQLYPDYQLVTLANNSRVRAVGQVVYSPPIRVVTPRGGGTGVNYIDLSRTSGIVVGLVTIDLTTQRIMTASEINNLGNAFPVPSDDKLPVTAWSDVLANINSLPGSLRAKQSVRIFERFYPVTPFMRKGL